MKTRAASRGQAAAVQGLDRECTRVSGPGQDQFLAGAGKSQGMQLSALPGNSKPRPGNCARHSPARGGKGSLGLGHVCAICPALNFRNQRVQDEKGPTADRSQTVVSMRPHQPHPSSGAGNSLSRLIAQRFDRRGDARVRVLRPDELESGDDGWVGPPQRGGLWTALGRWPGVLFGYRDLIRTCVWRELRLRFSGSTLGVLWPLVHPLFLFGIYYFVFAELLGLRMPGALRGGGAALGLWMFTGTLVWTNFADSVHRSTSCLVDQRNLIEKLAFPSQVLPLNIVLANLVTLSVAALALVSVIALTGLWALPTWQLLWLPVILLFQALFTTGLGLLCAALHVFLRDTQQLVGIALGLAMFLTPVFWVPSAQAIPGIERWLPLIELNPLHHLLQAWRGVLMAGEPALCFTASLSASLATFALWAVCLFILGHGLFRSLQHRFADEV